MKDRAQDGADWRAALAGFIDRTDRVLALIEGFMPEAEWLDDPETLTYLHSCVSTRRQRVRVPETPMHLDAILVDEDLTGGLEPRLGRAHLRTLTIMGFPSQTWPGLLDDLNRLAFPYRWVDARDLPRQDRRDQGARPHPPPMVRQAQVDHGDPEGGDDQRGVGADGQRRRQQGARRRLPRCRSSAPISSARPMSPRPSRSGTTIPASPRIGCAWSRRPSRAATSPACARRVNAIEAWLGSLPGHVYANVRQPPVSTLNLAHMMPFSAVWAGPERDEHFQAPPLFFARTEGSTPFRFSASMSAMSATR